jgi:hypothetical protein
MKNKVIAAASNEDVNLFGAKIALESQLLLEGSEECRALQFIGLT